MGQGRPTNAPSVWRRNAPERRLPQPAPSKWAITASNGDASDAYAGRRCPRVCGRYCNRLLKDAGRDGLMLKGHRRMVVRRAYPWAIPRQRKLRE